MWDMLCIVQQVSKENMQTEIVTSATVNYGEAAAQIHSTLQFPHCNMNSNCSDVNFCSHWAKPAY